MKHPFTLKALVPCSLLMALSAVELPAATSSFDLDVSDLEQKRAAKPPAQRKKSPPKKPAVSREETPSATEEKTDSISYYTVRPGDFIFKILMRNYGLNNDQAEALLPEIQKLNKLANIRNLTVGQKIAIPLGKRKKIREESESPAEKTVEPAPEHAEPLPVTVAKKKEEPAPPPPPVPTTTTTPTPAIASTPKIEQQVRRQPAESGIDLSKYPVFPAADGGKIVLDTSHSIPEETAKRLMREQPGLRIVSGKPGDAKQLLGKVLREAAFEEVNEDVSLIFGVDPQVSIDADFRVVVKDPKSSKTDAVLIDASSSTSAFSAIADYLQSQSIRYIDLAPQREKIRVDDQTAVITLQPEKKCERLDHIFEALKTKVEQNKKVDLGGFIWSIDRLFTHQGKRFAVTCGESSDAPDYMTERLLEMEGYSLVRLVENDPEKAAMEILGKLGVQPELRRHTFAIPGRESVKVELSGYLAEHNGRRVLLVRYPIESSVKGLLARMKPVQ